MISYFKKSVNSAYKASKEVVLKATNKSINYPYKSQNILAELRSSKKKVLSTKKMNQLANLSYTMQQFQVILITLFEVLTGNDNFDLTYLYDVNQLKKKMRRVRNFLVVCGYLVKHGASGFIDQFRERIHIFKDYASDKNLASNTQLAHELQNRAEYVIILLTDKKKLLREKQLAMLIKQKMKLNYQISNISGENQFKLANIQNGGNQDREMSKSQKIQNFLQNYLFKYVAKFDQKIDNLAQFLAVQAQKYLLEEMPENFQIDEIDDNGMPIKSQANLQIIKEQQIKFTEQKNKKKVVEKDLLQLND